MYIVLQADDYKLQVSGRIMTVKSVATKLCKWPCHSLSESHTVAMFHVAKLWRDCGRLIMAGLWTPCICRVYFVVLR